MAKPNIVVIMADDVGIWNIGACHRGMMAGRTPHLDKLAAEGMLFTDYCDSFPVEIQLGASDVYVFPCCVTKSQPQPSRE